jgi:hypothetical protein
MKFLSFQLYYKYIPFLFPVVPTSTFSKFPLSTILSIMNILSLTQQNKKAFRTDLDLIANDKKSENETNEWY